MKDYFVIDCDGHVIESDVDWSRFIDGPYKDVAPKKVLDNAGWPRLMMEGKLVPNPAGRNQGPRPPFDKFPTRREGMSDPHERLKDMDVEGIDVAVLFGTMIGLGIGALEDKGYAAAVASAYNNWLHEYCQTAPERLKALAVVPVQDVPAACRELERCVRELGCVGVMLPAHLGQKGIGDEEFFPLFEAAEALDVPICLHTGAGHLGAVQPAATDRSDSFFINHAIAFPFELMFGSASLLAGGVYDRFPQLRIGYFEAGIGWVPYWIERLDEHYERLWKQTPKLLRKPSEHLLSERSFFSCDSDEKELPHAVDVLGAERIMYASDYAHWDCRYPESVREITDRQPISHEAKQLILGGNAARLFKLPIGTPVA